MDGLLSLLLFTGIFYLMMRLGRGVHMAQGFNTNHIDPVCGMDVDVNLGYGKMYEGQLYRFCHRNCLDKFESDPDKYLNKGIKITGGEE